MHKKFDFWLVYTVSSNINNVSFFLLSRAEILLHHNRNASHGGLQMEFEVNNLAKRFYNQSEEVSGKREIRKRRVKVSEDSLAKYR